MSALLYLLGFAVLSLFAILDDDDPDDVTSGTDPNPDPAADTGATVADNGAGTITVELGADETGSLALFHYSDTEDAGIGLSETFEQRLYLVPEGVTIPAIGYETGGPELGVLVQQLGLVELGSWSLGYTEPGTEDPYVIDHTVDEPTITANAPIAEYDVTANTDGDDLIYLQPVGYVPPTPGYNGATELQATADTMGTGGSDWISARADGIAVSALGGDDLLEAHADNVTLHGGDGNDLLYGLGIGTDASGGPGDDRITMLHDGVARGDRGDDTLLAYDSGSVTLYGGSGSDNLGVHGERIVGYGGDDDDFLGVSNGGTAHGGAGNDHIQADAGTRVFGGDGDDLIRVYEFHNEPEAVVATGGTGADSNEFLIRGAWGPDPEPYVRITDFDPAEDMLAVNVWNSGSESVESITFSEAADGSYTDVLVNVSNIYGQPPASVIIRLDGVTGLTPDAVALLA